VVRLPYVGDVDVVGSPDLLLALLRPHQAPRRELVGSLLELAEDKVACGRVNPGYVRRTG
jgi:hypothetical protein